MKKFNVIIMIFVSLILLVSLKSLPKNEDNTSKVAGTIDLGIKQLPVTEKKLVVKNVMKSSSEQVESNDEIQVGENIGDDIFLPPLVENSNANSSVESEQIKLNVKEKPKKHLNFKEMLEQQDRELMKSYDKINSSNMNINVNRNIQVQNRDKVVLRSDLLPEQPVTSQEEVIDNSQTYLVIIDGEPKTLSGKEYRAYLNTQNSNQQVSKQKNEDYSLDSGVDDFLKNIKPEPMQPKKAKQSDDDIPDLNSLMD